MGIGIIGSASSANKNKVLVDTDIYDADLDNLSIDLEPGMYRVNAAASYEIAGIPYATSESLVPLSSGASSISLTRRGFEKNSLKSMSADYNGTSVTIQYIMPAETNGTPFLWGVGGTYVFTSYDNGLSWQAYSTIPGAIYNPIILHPSYNWWIAGGANGYHYRFSSQGGLTFSYYQSNTTKVNGWIIGDSGWVSYADDSDISYRSDSSNPDGVNSQVDLGGGGTDLDFGGYINGTYVVVDANRGYFTSTNNGQTWTSQGSLNWVRTTGGGYNHFFNFNNRLYAFSDSTTDTPLYYTTDGISWQADTSIVLPENTNWYAAKKLDNTNFYLLGASGSWFLTEDFVSFIKASQNSSYSYSSYHPQVSTTGKEILLPGGTDMYEFSLGSRSWIFEYIAETIDANA